MAISPSRRRAWIIAAAIFAGACTSSGEDQGEGDNEQDDSGSVGGGAPGGSAGTPATGGAPGTGGTAAALTLTYHRDVAPIVERYCNGCHIKDGLAPFALEDFTKTFAYRAPMAAALLSRDMPPLPADPGCRPFEDPRLMPDELRQVVIDWVAAGAPEGEPVPASERRSVPPMPADGLAKPTDIFDSGVEFTSKFNGLDEYRCFVVDPKLTAPVDSVAFSIGATNLAIVHHAFVDLAPPGKVAEVEALDAADPEPGYLCFGGVGFDAVRVGAYVPGGQVKASPNGTGITVPAGSRFVIASHLNYLNNKNPNRFSVHLWRANGPLAGTPRSGRIADPLFMLPAGAAAVTTTAYSNVVAQRMGLGLREVKAGRAWGASGHMHMLGTKFRIDVLRQGGGEECLLDIPAWNFHWQGDYRFSNPVDLRPGDRLRMTCAWDNSAANQPIVDGVRQAPRDVRWGEGSLDEMCLGGVSMTD
jgi:hypothetical protein